MNAETYHAAQSENVYACVIFNIPVINKALFDCLTVIQIDRQTRTVPKLNGSCSSVRPCVQSKHRSALLCIT